MSRRRTCTGPGPCRGRPRTAPPNVTRHQKNTRHQTLSVANKAASGNTKRQHVFLPRARQGGCYPRHAPPFNHARTHAAIVHGSHEPRYVMRRAVITLERKPEMKRSTGSRIKTALCHVSSLTKPCSSLVVYPLQQRPTWPHPLIIILLFTGRRIRNRIRNQKKAQTKKYRLCSARWPDAHVSTVPVDNAAGAVEKQQQHGGTRVR